MRALYPQITPIAVEVIEDHLRGFSAEDMAQLIGFLDRIRNNGEAQSGPLSPPTPKTAKPAE